MNRNGHCATAVLTMSVPAVIEMNHGLPWWMMVISLLGCCWGVVAPDDVEIRYTTVNGRSKSSGQATHASKTVFAHRGNSHAILLWVGLFGFVWWWLFRQPFALEGVGWSVVKSALFGISYGAMIHLLADIPNGRGIPVFPFGPRVCLHLWKASENQIFMCAILFVLTSTLSARLWLGSPAAVPFLHSVAFSGVMTQAHLTLDRVCQVLILLADKINDFAMTSWQSLQVG